MKKTKLFIFSFVFLAIGLFFLDKDTSLFEKHSIDGPKTPTATSSIRLNQHGSYFYVTEKQNDEMIRYRIISLTCMFLAMGGLYLYKKEK
ncbi:hypothetical protein [Aquirhabdus sp.]|uniref:hypothetical protein n=1 Tax=Aquirhabdus sp. TaxID=2824160 RepID=UPI00396CA8EB